MGRIYPEAASIGYCEECDHATVHDELGCRVCQRRAAVRLVDAEEAARSRERRTVADSRRDGIWPNRTE